MTDAESEARPGGNAAELIRSVVERIERLHEERKALSDDVADVYREAKGNGLDVKALRVVVRKRAQDPTERRELEALVDAYMCALGEES